MSVLCSFVQPLSAYDFSGLTALAEGALVGENVGQAVPGFEIRLLKNGELLFHQAFGDWSLDRPASVDSSTKTLSGALIMSIVESGEQGFSLDSRLGDFLSEYNDPDLQDITIRQAFSHTSGIQGQDAFSLILANPNITLRQAAQLISLSPLAHASGSTFEYGGLSMHAAGAAAEVATGNSFIDLFSERIATPLEMANTRFIIASDINPRVAGGVESTATEYARFMDMLLNSGVDRATGTRVLSQGSVAEMLRRQTTDEQPIADSPTENNRYGIGVWLNQLGQAGSEVDVLAAGARGFHSWIDSSQGLVFTFATDLTQFSNVESLSSEFHLAILEAIAPLGDYNHDGIVDASDYVVWRKSDGTPAGYDTWREDFGRTGDSGSAVTANSAVPEPATALVLLFAPMIPLMWRRTFIRASKLADR
jgi:CubicO group peptidase (beta-lactamase class C family)